MLLVADGHAFLNDPLHAAQANAQFILDQLANGLDAPVTEVINIIRWLDPVINEDHPPQQTNNVSFGHRAVRDGDLQVKFLIQFIAAHTLQIIMPLIEQLLFEKTAGIIEGSRVARTHALEEFDQGRFGNCQSTGKVPFWFLAQSGSDEHALRIGIHVFKEVDEFFIGAGGEQLVRTVPIIHSG